MGHSNYYPTEQLGGSKKETHIKHLKWYLEYSKYPLKILSRATKGNKLAIAYEI